MPSTQEWNKSKKEQKIEDWTRFERVTVRTAAERSTPELPVLLLLLWSLLSRMDLSRSVGGGP